MDVVRDELTGKEQLTGKLPFGDILEYSLETTEFEIICIYGRAKIPLNTHMLTQI